jgi:two-component system NarL family response regulator
VVAEASTGEEAVALHAQHRPDVTLMDLQLPGISGIDAIRAIRERDPGARIVVLTMYYGDEDVYRAFRAGAMAYVLKDAVLDDLVRVLHDVHQGKRVVPAEIAALLDARASQPSLTSREHQVLELLVTGKRNKEIAEVLGMSRDTARAHVKSIFQKFNVHDRTAAMAEALRRGIVHLK